MGVDLTLLEHLFDQVPDIAFFVKDMAGNYAVVNSSLVARHGLRDKSQVLGKRPRDICPGDFGDVPSRQDSEILRTGHPIIDHLELHWYAPHKPGWCLTTKLPIRDASGGIVGLIGISRDIRAPIQTSEIPVKVADALNRFEANLSDPMTPAGLARSAGLPPHRFSRFTKRVFGLTPSQYIAKSRIAATCRLLRETNEPIARIAISCGYFDQSAFTRAFRKLTGITPSQYRTRAFSPSSTDGGGSRLASFIVGAGKNAPNARRSGISQ